MNSKDQFLGYKFNDGLNDLGTQMAAPFSALSNFFLKAVNLQTDVIRFMNKSGSNNEYGTLPLEISKLSLSPGVYSILLEKAQLNEIEEYITKLVEQDLDKKEKESANFFETLREEVFSEINLLRQEFASRPVVEANRAGAERANDLQDSVQKLVEKQKADKEELQTLLIALQSEFLNQINQLKDELATRSVVPANQLQSNPKKEYTAKVNDLKEGQLVESDEVKGTIKEVIDVDF